MNSVKQILIPVESIELSIEFYRKNFGFPVKFQDGSRYAALDGGSVTLALVSAEENLTGKQVAIAVAVSEAEQFLGAARENGVQVIRDVMPGPHEKRAVVADQDGNAIVVYSKI